MISGKRITTPSANGPNHCENRRARRRRGRAFAFPRRFRERAAHAAGGHRRRPGRTRSASPARHLAEEDEQEDERGDAERQRPAADQDQLVVDVGFGVVADDREAEAEGDERRGGGVAKRGNERPRPRLRPTRRRLGLRRGGHAQTFSTSGRPENAGRHEDQRDREDHERRHVLVVGGEIGRPEHLDEADQEAAEHRAGQRADAAEHRGGEGLDARHEAVGEIDDAVVDDEHHPRDCGERRADDEGDRDRRVDVDAEQRRHLAILFAGALGAAERGVLDEIPEGGEQHRRHDHDQDLAHRQRHVIARRRRRD